MNDMQVVSECFVPKCDSVLIVAIVIYPINSNLYGPLWKTLDIRVGIVPPILV